uniref:Uncharacterized protein n=1 Tax=Leptobrachium leishanense TaxID=445787 RepID=A0A8C5R1R0_9ANUR
MTTSSIPQLPVILSTNLFINPYAIEKTERRETLPKITKVPKKTPEARLKEKERSLPQTPKETSTTSANVYDAVTNGDLSLLERTLKGSDVNAVNSSGETLLHVRTPLHRAAENGHLEAVRVLLKAGANMYCLDSDNQTPVHLAAQNNHQEVLKTFLKEEGTLYKNRLNILHMAATVDDSELAQLLLKNGASVDATDEKKQTPLFHAVSGGHEATVKVLLEAGASIDSSIIDLAFSTNNEKIFAVKLNLCGIIKALINKGTDVNATNDMEYTPLLLAAELGKLEAAQAVIEKEARLDIRTPNLNTALHLAVQRGDVSITKLLIRKGMNVNITGTGDQTPIHMAAFHNKPEMIDVLIEAGANINAVTKESVTPLHIASQRGNLDVAKCLLRHKANVNTKDKLSKTPLHLAVEGGGTAMVELLLNNNADANVADKDKKMPLHFAAALGEVEMVDAILKSQGRYGAKDMDGCTPIHYATISGSPDTVRSLLKAGKNKNVDDKNVWRKTPLHLAADSGHSDLISLLLTSGAAMNPLDSNRETPLHCACKAGHFNVVQSLVGWTQGEKANLQATNSLKKTPLQVAESGTTDSHHQITNFLKRRMHLIK